MAAEKQGTEGQGKWMYPKLYFIGDSNTQQGYSCGGFLGMLANEYIRICDVVARGFSGYTSDHLNLMIPELLQNDNQPKGTIETAVILLGSNDSVDEKLDNRHVPIKKFEQNIQNIVKALKENNVKNIVLMSPPPVDDVAWGKWLWDKKNKPCANFNSNLPKYVDVCKRVADMHNLTFVDLFNDMLTNQKWKRMQPERKAEILRYQKISIKIIRWLKRFDSLMV
ncbi:isoamyl acetate-hydrolyzing esterase 1 homolog [Hydractinia symbiolongicarpus]|uniref:isoamyl acetate-hydrolyzing esterase 1 homolog n=1 Tax=Hydractinia symbiolongicarpus TaxID=13093 RepID=UPI0025501E07|nr:isoamyl acetate-hydrolyzing esterase 1 homolog [Hydractinia symbiolongicarpus]